MSNLGEIGLSLVRGGTPRTREGLHQTSIEVRSMPSPAVEPMFTVYGKALPHRCETKDSALIRALIFINQTLGYKIGDVKYAQYLLLAR